MMLQGLSKIFWHLSCFGSSSGPSGECLAGSGCSHKKWLRRHQSWQLEDFDVKTKRFFLNRKRFGAINEKIRCRRRSVDRPHKKIFKGRQIRRGVGGMSAEVGVCHAFDILLTKFQSHVWVRFPQFVAPRRCPKCVAFNVLAKPGGSALVSGVSTPRAVDMIACRSLCILPQKTCES